METLMNPFRLGNKNVKFDKDKLDIKISYGEFVTAFIKWNEMISISPSGRHLAITRVF